MQTRHIIREFDINNEFILAYAGFLCLDTDIVLYMMHNHDILELMYK